MEKKLDKIKKAYEFKNAKIKLLGELKEERQEIKDNVILKSLEKQEKNLSAKERIRELKRKVKLNKSVISAGRFISFWGTLATLVSTVLTICGLWNYFNSSIFKSISLIFSITIVQFTVLILAKQDTNIKINYSQHVFKCKVLKFTLLVVSIYGNYTFFTQNRHVNFLEFITTLVLCIAIDVISILAVSISQDFKTLNKNKFMKSDKESLFYKLIYNLTFRFTNKINSTYEKNKNDLASVQDRDTKKESTYNRNIGQENNNNSSNAVPDRNTKDARELNYKSDTKVDNVSNFVQDRDIQIVKNTILNYRDGNICPSVSALETLTGLTKNTIIAAKKLLEHKGILKTIDNKTMLLEVK